MDADNCISVANLDIEFKRYLHIMKPYLGQLEDGDVIEICNSWIHRLSICEDNEKKLRNKYVYVLCYQLVRGILEDPFLKHPPVEDLPPINEPVDSDSSTEIEYLVIDADDPKSNLFYEHKKTASSEIEYHSQDNDYDEEKIFDSSKGYKSATPQTDIIETNSCAPSRKQTIICYTCPKIVRSAKKLQIKDPPGSEDEYEYRANNLIMKLREIKKQNMMLHQELVALRDESSQNCSHIPDDFVIKVDRATSGVECAKVYEKPESVKIIKNKLKEAEDIKSALVANLAHLQEQLDSITESKRQEIEALENHHQLQIATIRTTIKEEYKEMYDEKLEAVKEQYEAIIEQIRDTLEKEKRNMRSDYENTIREKERLIEDKDKIIKSKEGEIQNLKAVIDEQNINLHSVLNKLKSHTETNVNEDATKQKTADLEKRLGKVERVKTKCVRAYENKLMCLQREKHLAECSYQLQMVRQRAQIANEMSEEHQSELTSSLDKLEAKYKEIVATMQATAIQRRIQDQVAIETIIQAACNQNDLFSINHSQCIGKTTRSPKDLNHSFDSEISGLLNDKFGHSITKDSSLVASKPGFCLDSERLNELFEKVYIPQRDICGDMSIKK